MQPVTTLQPKAHELVGLVAGAGRALAARAAGLVLLQRRGLEVDARDRGQRREPGEHVGELALELAPLPAPERARQLADLLAEPHVRPGEAARRVAREVDLLDAALEVLDAHDAQLGLRERVTSEMSSWKPGSPAYCSRSRLSPFKNCVVSSALCFLTRA